MKKITLGIDENLMQDLGLNNSSDDAAFAGAIKNAIQKAKKVDELQNALTTAKTDKDTAVNALSAFKAETKKAELKAMLEQAVTDKKITVELSNQYAEDYAENLEGLKKVLNAHKAYAPATEQIEKNGEKTNKSKTELVAEYDKAFEDGSLEEMQNSNEPHYKEIIEAKFGKKA